jgi:hypothetical protein
MTVKRMDNVGIVVEDIGAAIESRRLGIVPAGQIAPGHRVSRSAWTVSPSHFPRWCLNPKPVICQFRVRGKSD